MRKARLEDIERVMTLFDQARAYQVASGNPQWKPGYPSREDIEEDIHQGQAYVWIDGEDLAGYGVLVKNDPGYDGVNIGTTIEGDFCVVHRMAVSDHYRGKGLGRRFLEALTDKAFEDGASTVLIDTGAANVGMRRVAENAGYRLMGEAIFSWGPRLVYVMRNA